MAVDLKRFLTPASSPILSLVSGWTQQGVKGLFATQQTLVDLAMRQTASAMQALRAGLSDPTYCPASIVTDLVTEATKNFISAQSILLSLVQQENDIVMSGVRERVGGAGPAAAMVEVARRSLDTYLEMQHEFLDMASQQAENWRKSAKAGNYAGVCLVDVARQGILKFAQTQEKLLTVIAEETEGATAGKARAGKARKTEVLQLARQATASFLQAQKSLLDIAGQQANANLDAASRGVGLISPQRFVPFAALAREGVRNFVEAEKSILDSMLKPFDSPQSVAKPKAERRPRAAAKAKRAPKRAVRVKKVPVAKPAHAGA